MSPIFLQGNPRFINGLVSRIPPMNNRSMRVILLFTLLILPLDLEAQIDRAQGYVFDDRNGNGIKDPDEPGLPGVLVSI